MEKIDGKDWKKHGAFLTDIWHAVIIAVPVLVCVIRNAVAVVVVILVVRSSVIVIVIVLCNNANNVQF